MVWTFLERSLNSRWFHNFSTRWTFSSSLWRLNCTFALDHARVLMFSPWEIASKNFYAIIISMQYFLRQSLEGKQTGQKIKKEGRHRYHYSETWTSDGCSNSRRRIIMVFRRRRRVKMKRDRATNKTSGEIKCVWKGNYSHLPIHHITEIPTTTHVCRKKRTEKEKEWSSKKNMI